MSPHERSDKELLSYVTTLVGSHSELTATLVAYLAEIEERRLELLSGYSSMFDFCQKKLGMSEGEAFRRILAARLSRRFPLVLSLLASGSVNLSTLELVRDRLTEDNHEELLAAVADKRKREVQAYLASRFPRADEPSRIRPFASIEPLSEGRFKVEFTASESLCDKLERCRDLLSHANPSRDFGVVIERALDLLLAKLERGRVGRAKRRSALEGNRLERARVSGSGSSPVGQPSLAQHERVAPNERPFLEDRHHATTSSRVSAAVKRQVFERDGAMCTYVASSGRRCEARAFLELDHIDPRAHGGSNDAANLRVRCRAHNRLWAEQVFGRERVEHFCQQKSAARARAPGGGSVRRAIAAPRGEGTRVATPVRSEDAGNATTFEKVRSALRNLGYRDSVARRAVATVAALHNTYESLDLEQTVREALLAATAA
jgi:hypothetical protein